jgi:hypothetical protein
LIANPSSPSDGRLRYAVRHTDDGRAIGVDAVVNVEWTVEVETCEGLAASERELEQFATALRADGRLIEPLAALHPERGVFSVIFEIGADTSNGATAVGEEAVLAAIARAGVPARSRAIERVSATRWH